jgi:hypothetical protein
MVSAPQNFNIICVEDFSRNLRFSTVSNLHTSPLCWKISVSPAKTRIAGFCYVVSVVGTAGSMPEDSPGAEGAHAAASEDPGRIE